MKTWQQTVLSQYASSEHLMSLLAAIDAWISPDTNFENFYTLIWNIDTAQGYGLDVWGRIVGVNRVLTITNGFYFGFAQADDPALVGTFGKAPFFSGESVTSNFTLTDDSFRQLILAKAAANITNGSIPAINAILMNLFPGRGNCYVVDNLDMTMTYKFLFPLAPFERAIVENSNVLPRPAGVLASADIPS